ncbi:AMP-binding protein [Halosimplex salinum]|uniref:AMP-binding protein n=1 Tax=Halosimplex salinum TaxID=1710538 RepID=UPI000F480470|nr:AMP-binding protein [Halosimplex salinum]
MRSPQGWVGDWSGKRAALSPDRVGLVDAATGTEYTYAALDRRANRCARLLADHGVTRAGDGATDEAGGRVAVVSRNRPEYVDLFFATAKTGGVLAPLSHRLAAPELAELLDSVDPALVVVEEPFADLVGAAADTETWDADCPTLSLPVDGAGTWTDYESALPDDDSSFDGPAVAPGDPHLFLHTGGSTGTPKETVISHEAIVWNSVNTITAWGLRDDDVTPMVFPMFHTGGWNVLTIPLVHMGGQVVIDREFDPGQILRSVEERAASVLVAVPAVLRMMVEHDRWDETDLSSLRFVKSGGGPCRESVMDAWWDRDVDLSQGYGLTECGPNNFAMPDDWPREKAHTVGVANMHVDARVVDDDGAELSPGEIGELELRSPHAADGYWGAPEETAETFGEWVSTGDLARVDADGYVSIEGRKKNMFVSGGENVYPAEVEDAIADHAAVADVVVVPVSDEQWGQVGKAVVEPSAESGADPAVDPPLALDELREFLDGRLARFKHPRSLAFVEELPTSGPSKIDRDAVEAEFGE